jgi:hypothetical protein
MQFNFQIDIEGIVAAAVAPERIQPLLDGAITKALKDALEDATGYRSEFRELLKKQLTEALPHGLRVHDVAKFQHMLNLAISNAVEGANAETLKAAFKKVAESVLPEVPARIKLSELLEEARSGFHKDNHERFYARFEPSQYSSGGGHLYLDSDATTRDTYRASMRLAFNGDGTIYALKLDGRDITPKSTPDAIGDFDGLLLAMYCGRTTLDVDMDEDDVESACEAKED